MKCKDTRWIFKETGSRATRAVLEDSGLERITPVQKTTAPSSLVVMWPVGSSVER